MANPTISERNRVRTNLILRPQLRSEYWVWHNGQMTVPLETTPKPDLRDLLAAERTFLAWIRTGLALMGFGFVVARFGIFLQQLQLVQHASAVPNQPLSLWFGTALIAVGVAVFLLSAWQHVRLVQELNHGEPVASRPSTHAVAIALFLALVGLAMAIYLISVRARSQDRKTNAEQALSMAMDNGIVDKRVTTL